MLTRKVLPRRNPIELLSAPSEQRRMAAGIFGLIATMALLPGHANAQGVDVDWISTGGGDFAVEQNWDPEQVPGLDDTAVFNLFDTYTVTFAEFDPPASSVVNDRLIVRNGEVTFDLGDGFTYELTNENTTDSGDATSVTIGFEDGDDAMFTLSSGTLSGDWGVIGLEAGSHGKVIVTGPNTQWLNPGRLVVGDLGTGELIIENGATVTGDNLSRIGSVTEGVVTVRGEGSLLDVTSNQGFLDIALGGGTGTLIIEDGGAVAQRRGRLGRSGGHGIAVVRGENSEWSVSLDLSIGFRNADSLGEVTITDGGSLTSRFGNIAKESNTEGMVLVTGVGSTWEVERELYVGGEATGAGGTGRLTIRDHGQVTVGRWELIIYSGSTVSVLATNDEMLVVSNPDNDNDAELINDGLLQVIAAPNLAVGDHTPVVADIWTGTGTLQTIGGVWDGGSQALQVSAAATTSTGVGASFSLADHQRLEVDGSLRGDLLVGFDPDSSGGPNLNFTATELSVEWIEGWMVLAAWNFDTDLDPGNPALLSMDIGTDWDADLLQVWHRNGNPEWQLFAVDLNYDADGIGSFLVDGFSDYAITVIPEPSALVLVALGFFALLSRGRSTVPRGK